MSSPSGGSRLNGGAQLPMRLRHLDPTPTWTVSPSFVRRTKEEMSRSRQDRAADLGVAGGWRRGGDSYPPPTSPPARPPTTPTIPRGVLGASPSGAARRPGSAARPTGCHEATGTRVHTPTATRTTSSLPPTRPVRPRRLDPTANATTAGGAARAAQRDRPARQPRRP